MDFNQALNVVPVEVGEQMKRVRTAMRGAYISGVQYNTSRGIPQQAPGTSGFTPLNWTDTNDQHLDYLDRIVLTSFDQFIPKTGMQAVEKPRGMPQSRPPVDLKQVEAAATGG
jgi:hypothetical protein